MRPLRILFLTAIALLLVVPATSAQEWKGQGRLQGVINDADTGDPVEGAKVILRHQNSPDEGPEPIETDRRGRWSFLGLAGGNWGITIEAEGYIGSEGSARVVERAFGPGETIRVALRPFTEEMMEEAAGNEVMSWIEEGNRLLGEGQYAAARAEYEKALPELEETEHPNLLKGIANTYYSEQNYDAAISTLERSLAIAPDDTAALSLITTILIDAGREEEAQQYMARMPEGAKMDRDRLINMGTKAFNEGDAATALEHFDRAVRENPEWVDAYYRRGLAHMNLEQPAEALADFQKVQELDATYKPDEIGPFIEYLQSQVDSQGGGQ